MDITERSAIVEDKRRIGDWELEPVLGTKSRGTLVSRVDRASKVTVLERIDGKTAATVTEAIVWHLEPIRDRGHTCTADHGTEFAGHREIAEALGVDFDFATPDPFWERGLNEPTHGRVRQDFPKGTDLHQVTQAQVRAVESRINHWPRKELGVRTHQEVFNAAAPL